MAARKRPGVYVGHCSGCGAAQPLHPKRRGVVVGHENGREVIALREICHFCLAPTVPARTDAELAHAAALLLEELRLRRVRAERTVARASRPAVESAEGLDPWREATDEYDHLIALIQNIQHECLRALGEA